LMRPHDYLWSFQTILRHARVENSLAIFIAIFVSPA